MPQAFEDAINALSDQDNGWWPFLHLRPDPSDRMTSWRVLLLAVLYGLPAALLGNIVVKVTRERADLHPLLFPMAVVAGFFVLYRFTFALCWNRRAARLAVTHDRAAAFRAAFDEQEEE
jgi:hypothetical protein